MKGRTFGYCRDSRWSEVPDWQDQRDMVLCVAEEHDLDDPIIFIDDRDSARLHFLERKAGRKLYNALGRKDHLVVYNLNRLVRNHEDVVWLIDVCRRFRITLHAYQGLEGPASLDFMNDRDLAELYPAFIKAVQNSREERRAEKELLLRQRKTRKKGQPNGHQNPTPSSTTGTPCSQLP